MAIEHNITHLQMFSSEFEDIVATGVTASTMPFSIVFDGITIFSSSFVPDSKGVVRIYDVSSLLKPYIKDVFADFTFRISGHDMPVRVFSSNAPVAESARLFLSSFFLSSAMSKKITALNRYEVLSFYALESCAVTVEARYFQNELIVKNFELLSASEVLVDNVTTIDVSPRLFEDYSMGELISYTVIAGRRRYTYEIHNGLQSAEPAVIFKNNFGVWETMYLVGTRESSTEMTRSLAYINGRYTLYHLDEQQLYKAKTGALLGGLLPIAQDLLRSRSIFLLNSRGEATDEIVITDEDDKFTNDDNELPVFTITYRRSRRTSSLVDVIRPPKLFDKTFDKTFD